MFFEEDIGIDLGTASVLVFKRERVLYCITFSRYRPQYRSSNCGW